MLVKAFMAEQGPAEARGYCHLLGQLSKVGAVRLIRGACQTAGGAEQRRCTSGSANITSRHIQAFKKKKKRNLMRIASGPIFFKKYEKY